jgi:formate hydrogenlyase transcriptional activator
MDKPITHIPDTVMDALRLHDWPGNIRELQNLLERAVIMCSGPELHLPPSQLRTFKSADTPGAARTLAEAEREHIVGVLDQVRWVVGGRDGAAERLGLARTTLISRMNKLGIVRAHARVLAAGGS